MFKNNKEEENKVMYMDNHFSSVNVKPMYTLINLFLDDYFSKLKSTGVEGYTYGSLTIEDKSGDKLYFSKELIQLLDVLNKRRGIKNTISFKQRSTRKQSTTDDKVEYLPENTVKELIKNLRSASSISVDTKKLNKLDIQFPVEYNATTGEKRATKSFMRDRVEQLLKGYKIDYSRKNLVSFSDEVVELMSNQLPFKNYTLKEQEIKRLRSANTYKMGFKVDNLQGVESGVLTVIVPINFTYKPTIENIMAFLG